MKQHYLEMTRRQELTDLKKARQKMLIEKEERD